MASPYSIPHISHSYPAPPTACATRESVDPRSSVIPTHTACYRSTQLLGAPHIHYHNFGDQTFEQADRGVRRRPELRTAEIVRNLVNQRVLEIKIVPPIVFRDRVERVGADIARATCRLPNGLTLGIRSDKLASSRGARHTLRARHRPPKVESRRRPPRYDDRIAKAICGDRVAHRRHAENGLQARACPLTTVVVRSPIPPKVQVERPLRVQVQEPDSLKSGTSGRVDRRPAQRLGAELAPGIRRDLQNGSDFRTEVQIKPRLSPYLWHI